MTHFTLEGAVEKEDLVACEEPLQIRVEGRNLAVLMRTPGHDLDLVTGFLLTEGLIHQAADIMEISACPSRGAEGTTMDVLLTDPQTFLAQPEPTAQLISSASCGLCGQQTLEKILKNFSPLTSEERWQPEPSQIISLPQKMRPAQSLFSQTGGVHACALFDEWGNLIALREDVGRHNALDKLIGHVLRQPESRNKKVTLALSGRVSLEMVQKALAYRLPAMAAVSAPTSLAIDLAQASGMALFGFTRREGVNAYTHRQSD